MAKRFSSVVAMAVLVTGLAWGPMRDPGQIVPLDGKPIVPDVSVQAVVPTMQDAGPTRF